MMKTAMQELIEELKRNKEQEFTRIPIDIMIARIEKMLPIERQQLEDAWVANDVAADKTEFNHYFKTTYNE